jgi:hypothetical protein
MDGGQQRSFLRGQTDLLAFSKGKVKKIRVPLTFRWKGPVRFKAKREFSPVPSQGVTENCGSLRSKGSLLMSRTGASGENPPPPVLIEDVTVGGQHTRPSAVHRLTREGKLGFPLYQLLLSLLIGMTFRYILEGYDKD